MLSQADEQRLAALRAELAALKQQRKGQAIAAKKSKQWVSTKNRLPEHGPMRGSIQVLAWAGGRLELCWFDDVKIKWDRDNGTWCIWPEDRVEGVTHYMESDWGVKDFYVPLYGPGIVNRLRYLWLWFRYGVNDMAYDLKPKGWSRGNAQLDKKVVYYQNKSGKVSLGLPEDRPAPKGCKKIICNNVFEAERFSELQRRQERSENGRTMEQREQVEGAAQKEWRSNANNLMVNARNETNREFMRAALERNENHKPWEYTRESYLHNEGFEEKR